MFDVLGLLERSPNSSHYLLRSCYFRAKPIQLFFSGIAIRLQILRDGFASRLGRSHFTCVTDGC